MKVYCVFMCEGDQREYLMKVFSTKDKAQSYIDIVSKIDSNDFEIVEWGIDE